MQIRWYGQSAFLIDGRVFVDPFARIEREGWQFDYPAIEGVSAELLLVTHEHGDHSNVGAIGGDPRTIRSTAGTFDDVVAIASEHDDVAGTRRGPNTIFRFEVGDTVLCHFGDFGQAALRPEQRAAIGDVDVLFLPIGGGPTIDGAQAAAIVHELAPRLVVPMHYRTERVNIFDPPDAFLDAVDARVTELDASELDTTQHDGVVVLRAP